MMDSDQMKNSDVVEWESDYSWVKESDRMKNSVILKVYDRLEREWDHSRM